MAFVVMNLRHSGGATNQTVTCVDCQAGDVMRRCGYLQKISQFVNIFADSTVTVLMASNSNSVLL